MEKLSKAKESLEKPGKVKEILQSRKRLEMPRISLVAYTATIVSHKTPWYTGYKAYAAR